MAWVIFGIQWKAPELIQHKLPLPYSLAGHKVIVGKGELVVVGNGLDSHRNCPPHEIQGYFITLFFRASRGSANLLYHNLKII